MTDKERKRLLAPLYKKYGPRWRYCGRLYCFTGDVFYGALCEFGRIVRWSER